MPGPIVRRLTQLQDVVGGVIGITQGGTGATSASAARTALGLQIGTNVQAFSATLAGLSSATYAAGTILGGNDDGGGVPTALTVGTGLSVSGVVGRIFEDPELLVRINVYGHRQQVPALSIFDSLGPFRAKEWRYARADD